MAVYDYETNCECVVIKKYNYKCCGCPVDEVFLCCPESAQFIRDIHRAGQKEASRRCNPNNLPLRQNLMAKYFC
jgi:hypothetical protein